MRYVHFSSISASKQPVGSAQSYHNAAMSLNGLHWSHNPIAKKHLYVFIKERAAYLSIKKKKNPKCTQCIVKNY